MIVTLNPDSAIDTAPAASSPSRLQALLQRLPWKALIKWWFVGVAFLVVGTGLLWAAKTLLGLPLWLATAVSAELTLLIRFFVNDAWVFGHKRPTWGRLWQFHAASAGGSVIWYAITNGLPPLGVDYLIASVVGSATSMVFSILTNFLWVWRHPGSSRPG